MSLLEQTIVSIPTYLGEGILSIRFFRAFLTAKRGGSRVSVYWTALYFIPTILLFMVLDNNDPLHAAAWGILRLVLLLVLQSVFLCFDPRKLSFLIISFLSGVYLLRYLITVFYIFGINLVTDFWYRKSLTMKVDSEDMLGHWMKVLDISEFCFMMLTSVLYVVLLAIYIRLISKSFKRKDLPLTKRETVLLVLPCITAVMVSFFIRAIMLAEAGRPNLFYTHPAARWYVPAICVLQLASIVAAVTLLQSEFAYRDSLKQKALLETQIEGMRQEVTEVNDLYDSIRAFKHDFRGHIANMAAYIHRLQSEENGPEERAEFTAYMEQLEGALDGMMLPVQTGNPITDVIVSRWMTEAEKRRVSMESDFRYEDTKVDAYDIAIILNNGLENAVRAAASVSEGDGQTGNVRLRSLRKGPLFFIEIENDYSGEIIMDDRTGLPLSSNHPGDSSEHGLGLRNIEQSAEKYLGAMDINLSKRDDRKIFTLTVMLNTGA